MFGKEKEKFYLSIFLILILAVFLVWEGIIEAKTAIDDNVSQIQDKNITLAAYGMREMTLEKNLENYNFVREKTDEINDYFVDENNLPDFIRQIEDIADQTSNSVEINFVNKADIVKNITVPAQKPAAGKNDASPPKLNDYYVLRLNVNGNFEQLEQFVARLEGMPYYSYIDSMNINAEYVSAKAAAAKNSSSINLKTILMLKAFKKQDFNGKN